MATTSYKFSGECKWAKVYKPDPKYMKYSIDLKLEGKDIDVFKAIGLKNTLKEDGWVTFRRDPSKEVWKDGKKVPGGPPSVVDASGNVSTELIGNGSMVTVQVSVYDYDNNFGKGKGSRLEVVRIDKLVEFKGKEDDPPADIKPRIMF